ncbi:MAG: DUF427 domain-containing protein [Hyphomicrobiales bacterium]
MSAQTVTMALEAIHNPSEPRHFMRLKPVPRRVQVLRNGEILADTVQAMRLTEIGKDVYDPVFYIPRADILARMTAIDGKSSRCPLKGDASYFSYNSVEPMAWTYDRPFEFTVVLKGLIAFYPDKVSVLEIGDNSVDY